jgi:hypothetical protein
MESVAFTPLDLDACHTRLLFERLDAIRERRPSVVQVTVPVPACTGTLTDFK